jgi:precorrin-2 dehydrogenase/sirohydrochlorin ferrochelatase
MGYYAAYLDVTDKKCLVVGGGELAEEKVRGLLESGAQVFVAWDKVTDSVHRLAAEKLLTWLPRRFEERMLDGCFLVIDASTDDATAIAVSVEARRRKVLVNVLDRPGRCDFIAPALVRHGPFQLAISTSGRSPFMASHVRQLLEKDYGPEWGHLVELVGELRDRLREQQLPLAEQQRIYARIPKCGALQLLRAGDVDAARRAIASCAAPVTALP